MRARETSGTPKVAALASPTGAASRYLAHGAELPGKSYPLKSQKSPLRRGLSPLTKMQRYLKQGEAGEVIHELPFLLKPLSALPTPPRWR